MKPIIPRRGECLMELAIRCNAVYICPIVDRERRGPLVAYAGKDSQERNLVGDIYFNFRKIEPHLRAVKAFADAAWEKLCDKGLLNTFDTVCGIPQGGRTFGQMLAFVAGKKFVYADKKTKPKEEGKKQEYTWDLSQFDFEEGERVAIAEDVFNNFQNTDNTLSQIADTGAEITLLVGALNRSPVYNHIYTPKSGMFQGRDFPVITSMREEYPEYEQDDPAVVDDITKYGIEFDVKKNWAGLCSIMKRQS